MTAKSERLSVLSDAEQEALYGIPNFDDGQQLEYLALSEAELAFVTSRTGLHAQVHCVLQIGYFKAKRAFFVFDWDDVSEDCAFVTSRYFRDLAVELLPISKHERYAQRDGITTLAGYQSWSSASRPWLTSRAAQLVRRDVTPSFVAMELVAALGERKIIRPGYTTLQEIVSGALTAERRRLGGLLDGLLEEPIKVALAQLLVHEDTLSELAVLKQDAKNFGHQHMSRERDKREMLAPLHHAAKELLPRLEISRQNLLYYASLVNYYTVFDLRRQKPEQARLYLLCFAWLRYRQFTDNLVAAMNHLVRHYEAETKAQAQKRTLREQVAQLRNNRKVGRLLLLYVDDQVADTELFGTVRRRAWRIMGKDEVLAVGAHMSTKQLSSLALRWDAIDKLGVRVRLNLRPIFAAVDFCGEPDNPWLQALAWIKAVFARQQRPSQRPLSECPADTLPVRLRSFLLDSEADSTGRRNTLTPAQAEGVLLMKYRTRTYYTAAQKALMWERWKDGWTLHEIGKLFDRPHNSIQGILSKTGGIRPPERRRCATALTLAEREEISRALMVGQSMRSIAARLGRAPSTISREIGRNGGQHGYRATLADQAAWERALRPKLCKLAKNRALARVVSDMLRMLWSPEQIAGWLKHTYPNDQRLHVSHETIYRSLFIQARGALKKELLEHLRRTRGMRRSRSYTQKTAIHGQIVDAVSISERPASAEDRAVPGHWEGDLVFGSGNSQIATLVERQTRYVMLVKLDGKDSQTVVNALIKHARKLPQELYKSLTWDRGTEMHGHKRFTMATDIQVYFCDPQSPWQRGSNENTNGLLRQYLPKGIDISGYSQNQLNTIARQLNERPRKTLGFQTPAERFSECVAMTG